MTVAPKRKCINEKGFVTIDVRAGDHLLYEVSFKGALAKFVIRDEEGRVILDDSSGSSKGRFQAEWPPVNGWMWDGEDMHTFVGIMALVTEYQVKVTHRKGTGGTAIVRDCTFLATKPSDVAFELVPVFVLEEGKK